VSFTNATLVLSIGEAIDEATNTGIFTETTTIGIQHMGHDSIVQVYPRGIRHILGNGTMQEWNPPGNRAIVRSSMNNRQVAVALSGGEIVYFELDTVMNVLTEHTERMGLSSNITALSLGPIPEGRLRSRFLAVGCDDNTVRMVSLDPTDCLQPMSMQAVNAQPESLAIIEMVDKSSDEAFSTTFLNIGLQNGVLLRTVIDVVSGQLTDTRARFLGTEAIKLVQVTVQDSPAVMALSVKPWLGYTYQSRYNLSSITFDHLTHCSNFSSAACPEGIVAISNNSLRIFVLDKFGANFNKLSIPLKYTPRGFDLHEASKHFIVVQADRNTLAPHVMHALAQQREQDGDMVDHDVLDLPPDQFGYPKTLGTWASCIQIINPFTQSVVYTLDLGSNETAFSCSVVTFSNRPHDQYLVVGTAQDVEVMPRKCSQANLALYKIAPTGDALEFVFHVPHCCKP
jgi:splicing factor 3B subunit 3